MQRNRIERPRGPWLAAIILAVCAVTQAAMAQGGEGQGPPPATVRVGNVASDVVQNRWDVVGRLREVRRAMVAAEQSGRVVKISAEEGDVVIGGETVLAHIDDVWAKLALRTAEAKLSQARASITEEEARLEQARRDHEFLRDLQQRNSAKPKEVADAATLVSEREATIERARAELAEVEAEVQRQRENVERLRIVAPFDGVVIRKMTEVGQWLAAGSPVAEIISTGQIDGVIDVPERLIHFVKPGDKIELIVESLDEEVTGEVESITPLANVASRTFPVKVRIDDRGGRFKSGMSITAHVPTGEKVERLTVPRDAVQRAGAQSVVWANLNGQAMPINVKVLFGQGDRYVIQPEGGGPPLQPGMQVVIEGAERLFPTQPLQIQESLQARREE
jgi:RND family efflux transporter MFP subunit